MSLMFWKRLNSLKIILFHVDGMEKTILYFIIKIEPHKSFHFTLKFLYFRLVLQKLLFLRSIFVDEFSICVECTSLPQVKVKMRGNQNELDFFYFFLKNPNNYYFHLLKLLLVIADSWTLFFLLCVLINFVELWITTFMVIKYFLSFVFFKLVEMIFSN